MGADYRIRMTATQAMNCTTSAAASTNLLAKRSIGDVNQAITMFISVKAAASSGSLHNAVSERKSSSTPEADTCVANSGASEPT